MIIRIVTVMAAFMVLALPQQGLFSQSATEIIDRSEKAVRGETQIAQYSITIKKRRWTRTLKMTSWESRKGKKSFARITAPKKDRGNSFLLLDKDMWQYNPKSQRVIKIDSSMMNSSWMGSDFSNDDIVKESSIVEDYIHTLMGKETIDGFECYKIKLDPRKNAAVVWGKIIYYARTGDYLPVRKEYYNERGEMKKLLVFSDFKRMHDRVIPTRYMMKTVSRNKRKKDEHTVMQIDRIKYDVGIDPRVFTRQNLQRR